MLNYLQDVHVKVTLFIKEGLQRYNGSFVSIGKWKIPFGKVYMYILINKLNILTNLI